MNSNIKLEIGLYGTKATVITSWRESFLNYLIENNIEELELNDGKGWRGDNLHFLKFLPNLKSLIVIDLKLESIEAIHNLTELRKIKLITYSKSAINFKLFPKLQECSFEWIKGSDSLFEMTNIKRLFVNKYRGKDSSVFSKMINLEKLSILNCPIDNIKGISSLKKLTHLRLANLKNIKSLDGMEDLTELHTLEIQRCKNISEIYQLYGLIKLKHLFLLDLGSIETITGIEKLANLEKFLFYESTNVLDGNISPLRGLKNLTKISFQNRKHYSHKREDFGELYN